MIDKLWLDGVGPAARMDFEFGQRLNVLTGDNGLGKSFVLDCVWWAMTGSWPEQPALPPPPEPNAASKGKKSTVPSITWTGRGKNGRVSKNKTCTFSRASQQWRRPQSRPLMPGLMLYARVDGGFSVWDPARNYWRQWQARDIDEPERPEAYHFSRDQVWNGLRQGDSEICNGLIRDWVSWQYAPHQHEESPFQLLCKVLEGLSPHGPGRIEPGEPRRVFFGDPRTYPTLQLPYGTIPLPHASAGIRRIIALAYLTVWAWHEHVIASMLIGNEPDHRMIILVDEVETHLHPEWQRRIVPALLDVLQGLYKRMQIQALITTHAPLVLASLEPKFDPVHDRVFSFQLESSGASPPQIQVRSLPWVVQGDALNWLLSDVFGLRQARSLEAERAIEAAEAWMRNDRDALPDDLSSQSSIDKALRALLGELDPFWPRWIVASGRPL